jgi:hypothetical protein
MIYQLYLTSDKYLAYSRFAIIQAIKNPPKRVIFFPEYLMFFSVLSIVSLYITIPTYKGIRLSMRQERLCTHYYLTPFQDYL